MLGLPGKGAGTGGTGGDLTRITKSEKREFIRRCKSLALQLGERTQYHPARFHLTLHNDLNVYWRPDELCLFVRTYTQDGSTTTILEEVREQVRWYHVLNVRRFLEIMREMMVLDDLADL